MFLTASTALGVTLGRDDEAEVILDENLFFRLLRDLPDTDVITADCSPQMVAKIKEEYGISR